MLQGAFERKNLNLLFVFQVNCPGCFSYGFPLVKILREKYSDSIAFLGLSTAFEDYHLNNLENTKALIQQGKLVGETSKMFKRSGVIKLPYSVKFPIGMDSIADASFDIESLASKMCQSNPDFINWSPPERQQIQQRIKAYLLRQERVSLTFYQNQFQGTPTFVLFTEDYEIRTSWFGHAPLEHVESTLDKYVGKHT